MKSVQKTSTSDKKINARIFIALNGVGTAEPRSAVAEFLRKKERRYGEPDFTTYSNRDFIQKFSRKELVL